MAEKTHGAITHPLRRTLLLGAGFLTMAFAIIFSIKACLGTSPISSLPYVLTVITGISVGMTTIIVNFGFIFLQMLILRGRFEKLQLLQFPAVLVFGAMVDLAGWILEPLAVTGYAMQWCYCLFGAFLLAAGISLEIRAGLVPTSGEGIVLAICKVVPVKFGNMKVIFDVTLVCISIALSLAFLGEVVGVREGTVAAALLVGQFVKLIGKAAARLTERK